MPLAWHEGHALKPQKFIDNESFRRWVFFNPRDEHTYWKNYLAEHPEQQESADVARSFLLAARGELPDITDQQVREAVGQLLAAAPDQHPSPLRSWIRWTNWQPLRVAASVILMATASWFGWQYAYQKRAVPSVIQERKTVPSSAALTEVTNSQVAPRLVRLADGSLVVLQQSARIRFPKQFNGFKRDVFLSGNAFFEVVRNSAKPFRVFARELTTEVLGTSFLVNAPETGGFVNVLVKTGKVAVSTNPAFNANRPTTSPLKQNRSPSTAVVLLPNQQVTFSKNDARLIKRNVSRAEATVLPATTQAFSFRRTPLPLVLDALAKAYGINIRYNRDELSGCTLTAQLDDPSLFARLNIIAASTGSTYELQNGQLVIHSSGCR